MTWTTPHEGPVETLKFHTDPRRWGLGHRTDVDGVVWDVHAIVGARICARRVDQHPSYYGTAPWDSTAGFHTWTPYDVEVVGS